MNYNKLTKAELIKALTSLRAISESAPSVDAPRKAGLQDLQVYQIELEMQNRELREAQQKLEASRDRYADLYDFAPTGYMTLDKKGGILEINLTGAAILGVERSRLLGMPFFTCVAGSESQKFREHLRQCKRAKEKVTTELRLTAGNGKLIEAQLSSLAVQDPKSLPTVYHTVMTDITERKRAEEILQKRTEQNIRYQAALLKLTKMDNSDWLAAQKRITEEDAKTLEVERVSIWLFNEDRSEIVCEDLYRSSRNDHEKGLRLQARQYPRYFQALEESRTIAANDARRDPRTNEFTEGYLKPFAITSMLDVPVWLHGKVVGIVCHEHTGPMREWKPEDEEFAASIADLVSVALEASERKRAEAALRESEQRFRLMADDAPVLIWESGTDALCTYFNKPWLIFTGRSMEQELGNGWAEGVHPEDLPCCLDIYQSSFNARRPFEMEYRLRHFDGEYRWVLDRGAPRFAPDGEFAGYTGSCIEITVRKRAEEAIRRLNVELEERVRERTAQLEATVRNLQNEIAQRARAEELLRLQSFIVNNMSEGACLVRDCDQVIVYANPKFESMFGYSPSELNGKPLTILNYEGDGKSAAQTATRIVDELHEKGEAVYEVHNVKKDGTPFWCRAHTVRFEHPEFGVVYVAIHEDITERRRAEKKFQNLLEFAPDAMVIANKNGEIILSNAQTEKLFGYSRQELSGRNITMLMPDRFRERHLKRQADYFANPLTRPMRVGLELYGLRRDGREFPAEISLGPLETEEGTVVTAVIRDITERKQAEAERARLAAIVESSHDGIAGATIDGTIVSWNRGAEKIFGYTSDEAIGRPIYILSPPDRREEAAQLVVTLKQGKRVEQFETIRLRKDGTPINVSLTLSPIQNDAGQVTGIAAIARDITDRKQAQEALRRNEEYFRSLIENASDIISVVNADGTIRYGSPAVERVLGYKPDDMIGKNVFDLIHPDDLPRLLDIFDEVVKTPGLSRSVECRARHQDGLWRFFESAGKTLRDETGAMIIVVNSRDITERKQAEEQIQFLYRTTQAVNQAANFYEALAIALREICTLTGWEYGEAWVPSADGTRLECSPAWHGDSRRLASFRAHSEELRFEANESLPGRIWAVKQIKWMNDLASLPVNIFRRAPMVLELGLKTAIGVPVLADGEVLAVLVFFSAEAHAEDQHLLAMFSTVAGQLGVALQRKQTEQELRSSHEQLRGLYASLQSVREEERTRVAREIHDELGQMLTALKIDLSWLAKRLPASQEPLLAKTEAMSKLTDMTIASVKRISAELRPGLLDHLGLAEAIAWQAGQFRERTGIECKVELAPESINLDRERSTILFRIVQEALTNVARHAQATSVRISLTQRAPKLLLKVRDNGKGITHEQIFDPHSFGLIGIRERVHPWGGKIKIAGVPGKGTVVFVSLPVNPLPQPACFTLKVP